MNPRHGHESPIRLGRGRRFSREALTALGRAVVSRNPATDWAKGRVLTMGFTVLFLVWGLASVGGRVAANLRGGPDTPGLIIDGAESRYDGDMEVARGGRAKEQLRNDLFKVPKPEKNNTKKAPKTNPVELLRLLELQGVLGGTTPRAIVFYKRTQKTVTVSVGDDLGEFKVMEIRDGSVILKWRDELLELSL